MHILLDCFFRKAKQRFADSLRALFRDNVQFLYFEVQCSLCHNGFHVLRGLKLAEQIRFDAVFIFREENPFPRDVRFRIRVIAVTVLFRRPLRGQLQ